MTPTKFPSAQDIHDAYLTISPHIIKTPLIASPHLSDYFGTELCLKLETMQYTSSFKTRGATLAINALGEDERKRGVVTMSAGNHGQALAYCATQAWITSTIVMPEQTPFAKIARTQMFGGNIIQKGRTLDECQAEVNRLIAQDNAVLIHPFDDWHVICGQGTVGLEMLEQAPDLDTLIVPIGGGGLISGIAVIAKHINPEIRIIGVEAELYPSMSMKLSGHAGSCGGETLAEGIAVKVPGQITAPIIEKYVDDIVLVSERSIEWAIGALAERQRVISEGAGAAGIAALYQHKELTNGKKTGVVICGGNIDTRLLSSILTRNMMSDGRLVRFRIDISDEPGMLANISTAIGNSGGNIVEIYHQRMFYDVPAKLAKIDAVVDTRGAGHVQLIKANLEARNFTVSIIDELAESGAP